MFGRNRNEVKFIRRYSLPSPNGNVCSYEMYNANRAEAARQFLLTRRVSEPLHYVVVETPEGNWGIDIEGLYLERFPEPHHPLESAAVEGIPAQQSANQFGLVEAAQGRRDNFVHEVTCGSCRRNWFDGLRYRAVTVVRCPHCERLNRVDTWQFGVEFTSGE
jgi:hypothetical protein